MFSWSRVRGKMWGSGVEQTTRKPPEKDLLEMKPSQKTGSGWKQSLGGKPGCQVWRGQIGLCLLLHLLSLKGMFTDPVISSIINNHIYVPIPHRLISVPLVHMWGCNPPLHTKLPKEKCFFLTKIRTKSHLFSLIILDQNPRRKLKNFISHW